MTDTETQTEMYEQTQAFPKPPKTPLEIADEFLEHFQGDVESAEKSLVNARVKLGAAQILRDDAEENLRRERVAAGVATVEEVALDMKRSAEAAGMGLSFRVNSEEPIVITEAPAVDPITGEVDEGPLPGADGSTLDDPGPETPVSPVVFAFYPGDDDPHETPVGDRTRYSELVADYFTAAGLSAEVDADEWTVLASSELTQDGGGYRSLHDVIVADDYGQELLVVAADQGSVTGVAAAEESAA